MNKIKIDYSLCTPEDIQCLGRFEDEIQKAVTTVKGRTEDVYWKPYTVKGIIQDRRYFMLFLRSEPEEKLGPGYGQSFLANVSKEEFYEWITGNAGSGV